MPSLRDFSKPDRTSHPKNATRHQQAMLTQKIEFLVQKDVQAINAQN